MSVWERAKRLDHNPVSRGYADLLLWWPPYAAFALWMMVVGIFGATEGDNRAALLLTVFAIVPAGVAVVLRRDARRRRRGNL